MVQATDNPVLSGLIASGDHASRSGSCTDPRHTPFRTLTNPIRGCSEASGSGEIEVGSVRRSAPLDMAVGYQLGDQ